MPILAYTDDESISPRSFLDLVDENLEQYLTLEVDNQDGREYGKDAEAELLRNVFAARRRFSEVLQSELSDMDWSSEEPMPAEVFSKLCERVSGFADKLSNAKYDSLLADANARGDTVMGVAGKEILGDEAIRQNHMSILFRFGEWLKNKFVTVSQTQSERSEMAQFEAFSAIRSAVQFAVASIAMEINETGTQEIKGKLVLHSLVKLVWSKTPPEQMQKFVEALEEGVESLPEGVKYQEIQNLFESLIKQQIGHIWISELAEEQFKVVNIDTDETASYQLLPIGNFYFQPTIAEAPEVDHLPLEGNMHELYDQQRLRNVSLFNSSGEKMTWGDFSSDEIQSITGPYYVLSQRDSYHDTPEWAILPESEMPSIDVNRPKGSPDSEYSPDKRLLRLSYVKAVAMGKIENGEYVENPKNIQWSSEEEG